MGNNFTTLGHLPKTARQMEIAVINTMQQLFGAMGATLFLACVASQLGTTDLAAAPLQELRMHSLYVCVTVFLLLPWERTLLCCLR